jgi:predicted hotdog family 3-hydroxylacyl-ACP dehydratase
MLTSRITQAKNSIHCTSTIDSNNPLLSNGLFPVLGGIELLAQASGVLFGNQSPDNAARPGAIIQVKSFQTKNADIPIGSVLNIHARYTAGSVDAALCEGEVYVNEQRFFQGILIIAVLPEKTK